MEHDFCFSAYNKAFGTVKVAYVKVVLLCFKAFVEVFSEISD